jgi:hypothetical protein
VTALMPEPLAEPARNRREMIMSRSKRIILENYQTGRRTEVSARTASRVPAEINRRRLAEFRLSLPRVSRSRSPR